MRANATQIKEKKWPIYIYIMKENDVTDISSSKFTKENGMTLTYRAQNLWRKMIWHWHIEAKIYEWKWYDTNISNSKFMKENDMIPTYRAQNLDWLPIFLYNMKKCGIECDIY